MSDTVESEGPTPLFSRETAPPGDVCHDCGSRAHTFAYQCPFNLHGEEDPFKSACAICQTRIPSGSKRHSDPFRNLYCSVECQSRGKNRLIRIAMNHTPTVATVTDIS